MFGRLWDFFVDTLIAFFIPMVCAYNGLCTNLFLNTSASNATGLEYAGNVLLTPVQFLCAGRTATPREDGSWEFVQRFDYNHALWPKAAFSIACLPASILAGTTVKGLAYLSADTRSRHFSMLADRESTDARWDREKYLRLGIEAGDPKNRDFLISEGYQRRPGDETHMKEGKECLKEVARVLNEAGIPWWVDCGTLLGTYRYGGIIPWDLDIDIAILADDFEAARKAFNKLDRSLYSAQDWSGRDFPNSLFKVYARKTNDWIDVYCYTIDAANKELSCIFSLENNVFCPEWWKIDERRFKKPIAFQDVFPLKRALFDGIEVLVPFNAKPFLQRYYGENLSPAKIFDPKTARFEKDLSHPYWQNAHVH